MIPEQDMYFILAVLMAVVTLAFAMGVARVAEEKRMYYLPVAVIPAIMAVGFGLMSQGVLLLEPYGTTMPAARLVGYEIMFPIMAVYIGLAGGLGKRRTVTVAGGMFLVVLGVIFSYGPEAIAAIGPLMTIVVLIAVGYLLLRPYNRVAQDQPGELKLLFGKLRNLLLLMWVLYIAVALTSRAALGMLDVFGGVFMASYLDLVATVAFGAIILQSRDAIDQLADESSDPPSPTDDQSVDSESGGLVDAI